MVLTANLTYVTVQTLPLDRILCAEVALSSWGGFKATTRVYAIVKPSYFEEQRMRMTKDRAHSSISSKGMEHI